MFNCQPLVHGHYTKLESSSGAQVCGPLGTERICEPTRLSTMNASAPSDLHAFGQRTGNHRLANSPLTTFVSRLRVPTVPTRHTKMEPAAERTSVRSWPRQPLLSLLLHRSASLLVSAQDLTQGRYSSFPGFGQGSGGWHPTGSPGLSTPSRRH